MNVAPAMRRALSHASRAAGQCARTPGAAARDAAAAICGAPSAALCAPPSSSRAAAEQPVMPPQVVRRSSSGHLAPRTRRLAPRRAASEGPGTAAAAGQRVSCAASRRPLVVPCCAPWCTAHTHTHAVHGRGRGRRDAASSRDARVATRQAGRRAMQGRLRRGATRANRQKASTPDGAVNVD